MLFFSFQKTARLILLQNMTTQYEPWKSRHHKNEHEGKMSSNDFG
jgi:hypothetical protein